MPTHSYNIEKYESILKSEATKLTIIAVMLSFVLIALIVYSVFEIKNNRTKIIPYIQLIGSLVLSVFLIITLGSQINSYTKDIAEKTYLQYEGSANIRVEKQILHGGIPATSTDYIISFEHNGEKIELFTKNYGLTGDIEKIYIVYSKYSHYILEIIF